MDSGTNTLYGDLLLDDDCLFADRGESKIHFTKNERAVLLALSRNPNRLLTRSRLLDEISAHEDRSDRYIDFLVNRLRLKLGDDPKSPIFINTRYGEGYVWVATPSAAPPPADVLLVIASKLPAQGDPMARSAAALVERLRETIGVSVGPQRMILADEAWCPYTADRPCHLLNLSFQTDDEVLGCVVTLREFPSKRIVTSLILEIEPRNFPNLATQVNRIADAMLDVLHRRLGHVSTGLGLAPSDTLEARLHAASSVLLGSNPRWAQGAQLAKERAQDPLSADRALQWCMHLFSTLTVASPFESIKLAERQRMEREIEATVLAHLPAVEDNPLLMFAAAKLLYFVDRGHLDLAEDLAERSLALTGDSTVSLALMGQLRGARGRFDEAVHYFDQGAKRVDLGPDFQLHIRVMKCLALLAAGNRAMLDLALLEVDTEPPCPSHIACMVDWTFSPHERDLSPSSAQALAAIGPAGAANALEYAYFTSARQIIPQQARANVMRGLIAQVTRIHGPQVVPPFLVRTLG